MPPSVTDQIWNRAAMESGGATPLPGDSALAALLRLHGMVMNSGLHHAAEVLTPDQFAAGVRGFEYLGLFEMVAMLNRATNADVEELERLDAEYGRLIPSDRKLFEAFERVYAASLESFSP